MQRRAELREQRSRQVMAFCIRLTVLNTESVRLFFSPLFSFWLELFEPDLLLLNKSVITNSNAFRIFSQICYLPRRLPANISAAEKPS